MKCEWPTCRSEATNGDMCYMHWKTYGGGTKPKEAKPLPKKSETRKVEEKDYRKIVAEMLADSKECELKFDGCTKVATGLHHQRKRAGKNYLDKRYLKRSCDSCNLFCELHPLAAIASGASVSKFKPETV